MSDFYTAQDLLEGYSDQDQAERTRRYEALLGVIARAEQDLRTMDTVPSEEYRELAWLAGLREDMERWERNVAAGRPFWDNGGDIG